MAARAKIMIVDDHPLVREGIAARVSMQPDMEVCCEAAGVNEALARFDAGKPELVIVDITLKDGHGLDLIRKISLRKPKTRILVVSAHEEGMLAERALRAGAHGFINKQEAQAKVIDAIRAVLNGERYMSTAMMRRLVGRLLDGDSPKGGISSLSNRELEVFELIGRGESTRSIAHQLNLSVHTIESHRENIRAKLNLRNGAELVQSAVQWVLESR